MIGGLVGEDVERQAGVTWVSGGVTIEAEIEIVTCGPIAIDVTASGLDRLRRTSRGRVDTIGKPLLFIPVADEALSRRLRY